MATSDDDIASLQGKTLADLIKDHGDESCGDSTCKIEAARAFIARAKATKRPWEEVLHLHVYTSILRDQRITETSRMEAEHSTFQLLVFDLVQRLGGIVFTPPLKRIEAMPGELAIMDDTDVKGGLILRISPPSKDEIKARKKRTS